MEAELSVRVEAVPLTGDSQKAQVEAGGRGWWDRKAEEGGSRYIKEQAATGPTGLQLAGKLCRFLPGKTPVAPSEGQADAGSSLPTVPG